MHVIKPVIIAGCVSAFVHAAHGQSTGGVISPVVNEGYNAVQYRVGFDPDSDDLAQRIHVDTAFNDDFMGRIVVQGATPGDGDAEFSFVQAELFWDLSETGARFHNGVRFDARIRDAGQPATLNVNFMNQFNFAPGWHARAVLLTAVDVGDDGRDGVLLQTRSRINRRLADGIQIGAEMFSVYGSTEDFRNFDDQSHQIGPHVQVPITGDWGLFASALFGITDGSDDTNLKLWITRTF
ncbi:MAG: hypothetical protein AAGJ32_09195 [Pseudomonadota bacterium]